MASVSRPYDDDDAVLATMHGKERVIAPLLQRALGLRVQVTPGIDTDRFGTFSRDIDRSGSQLDAARAKIVAAFEISPGARVAVASEGSFGPHPQIPFVPLAREIVVLKDCVSGLELIGHHAGMETNFSHAVVADLNGANAFAERVGFPGHGVIVIGCADQQPAPGRALIKDIGDWTDLQRAVETVIANCGAAFVETDMRAHRNPTRMRTIKRATLDLVRRFRSFCPDCARPGFAITQRLFGLPCSWCGGPTLALKSEVYACEGCGYRVEHAVKPTTADPGQCEECNP
ncbi:hypothetical protein GTW51_22930 [Aurantimonas aggregata]|uniref:DUF6671 domain-containing protein n=1 Tax=Aurantimonas aggregata TaxID=2047720 RepID=A0A6L9MNM1_9HYPH|nr:DUF6671 family protein [Aurantimonas aggregata]NDV89499.1 hypothetical protein [Aurantimonas aggregata]